MNIVTLKFDTFEYNIIKEDIMKIEYFQSLMNFKTPIAPNVYEVEQILPENIMDKNLLKSIFNYLLNDDIKIELNSTNVISFINHITLFGEKFDYEKCYVKDNHIFDMLICLINNKKYEFFEHIYNNIPPSLYYHIYNEKYNVMLEMNLSKKNAHYISFTKKDIDALMQNKSYQKDIIVAQIHKDSFINDPNNLLFSVKMQHFEHLKLYFITDILIVYESRKFKFIENIDTLSDYYNFIIEDNVYYICLFYKS